MKILILKFNKIKNHNKFKTKYLSKNNLYNFIFDFRQQCSLVRIKILLILTLIRLEIPVSKVVRELVPFVRFEYLKQLIDWYHGHGDWSDLSHLQRPVNCIRYLRTPKKKTKQPQLKYCEIQFQNSNPITKFLFSSPVPKR